MSKPIYVLSGPNLNLLGVREPEIYGKATLDDVRKLCEQRAAALGRSVVFHQSNHEGQLIALKQVAEGQGQHTKLKDDARLPTAPVVLPVPESVQVPPPLLLTDNIFGVPSGEFRTLPKIMLPAAPPSKVRVVVPALPAACCTFPVTVRGASATTLAVHAGEPACKLTFTFPIWSL